MRSNSCRYRTTSRYMLSVTDFDPKGTISKVRVHGGTKFVHAGRWSIAKCRFSAKGLFDHHGKAENENVKEKVVSKNEKTWTSSEICEKKWWTHYRLRMRWCENSCVKVENVKTAKTRRLKVRQGMFPSECPQEHTACTDLLCRSGEGRGCLINRLWSP